ncbi:trypsin-like peptidase domain-containing protein [Georgenia sp. M64]|uniref:S1C family serine protease n=1 Tax=Georgenia sp. M64 TaxID=3120520 RepID=UPI0030E4B6D2
MDEEPPGRDTEAPTDASPYDYEATPAPRPEPFHRVGHGDAAHPALDRDDAAAAGRRFGARWRRRATSAHADDDGPSRRATPTSWPAPPPSDGGPVRPPSYPPVRTSFGPPPAPADGAGTRPVDGTGWSLGGGSSDGPAPGHPGGPQGETHPGPQVGTHPGPQGETPGRAGASPDAARHGTTTAGPAGPWGRPEGERPASRGVPWTSGATATADAGPWRRPGSSEPGPGAPPPTDGVATIFAPSPDAAGWARYGPAEPEPERQRRGVARGVVVLLVLLALVTGMLLGALGARSFFDVGTTGASATLPVSSGAGADRAPESVAGIAEQVLPSTVYIEAQGGGQASSGTGMVLREDGYLVTNNHVIEVAADGGSVVVVFPDGAQEAAEIVGRTSDYDLAVLRVGRTGLIPLVLADSDSIAVGDPVIAVGAPLGLEGTVTTGIVSALNRPVRAGTTAQTFINAIQTDAAINPGNSGGPLVDAAGQVIGINSAIAQTPGASQATGSIGLGFAIPANQVRRTAEQLIASGRATYPIIGVALDTRYSGEGVQVMTDDDGDTEAVTSGGPGAVAGIEPGDVILAIDGRPVTDPDELIVAIRSRAPGETVTLLVRRGADEREVDVVLGEGP